MKEIVLDNGLKVIYEYKKSNSVVIQINVKVGSNYENKKNLGICHFIEHMLFEGTKRRGARQIALEVEGMGGEINAFTLNERTSFYVSVLNKYFDKGLEVLSDIIKNPIFREKAIEKEKKIVLDEKKIYVDDPSSYQWLLFLKNLYKKHPTRWDGFGNKETINSFNRNKLIKFHQNYYKPNNITLVVVGGVKNIFPRIKKAFSDFEGGKVLKYNSIKEPLQIKKKCVIRKRKIEHSYYVLGYKTTNRINRDSYSLDVISYILGYGQSSRLFNEMRIKRGIGYNVGILNDLNKDYGYFAGYITTSKENIGEVRKIVNEQFKLKDLKDKEIKQAKNMIEGFTLIRNENNKDRADWISYWDLMGDYKKADNYIREIKKVKREDVLKSIRNYFRDNYVEVIIKEK